VTKLPLHCPTCSGALLSSSGASAGASSGASAGASAGETAKASVPDKELHCTECKQHFPLLGDVHCLLPTGALDLAVWEARAHKELQDLLHQQKTATNALEQLPAAPETTTTRQRLQTLAAGYAGQLECLDTILAPLLNARAGSDRATYNALHTSSLIDRTTLFSYSSNLFRDWVWGETENDQALAMLKSVAPGSLGRTLVLGAGGGRLAWDLANGPASCVYAVDINPFTSFVAATLSRGESVSLWEFPLAPVGSADVAIKRTICAGAPATDFSAESLTWLLADARALPFPANSFDTVVTPWFTDVVQTTPAQLAAQINQLLVAGGRWLNFGSVAFANADPTQCLLLTELLDLVKSQGFAEPRWVEQQGPYLCSPHSRYGRQELLHAFAAAKEQTVRQTEMPTGSGGDNAPWLTNTDQPIPALTQFQDQALATQVHAYLMSLIDGKRSINAIAEILQQRKLLSAREAVPLIQGFLEKMLP